MSHPARCPPPCFGGLSEDAREATAEASDDGGFVEEHLWTGIGRARSGCGAAIVGDPDRVLAKPNACRAPGIDASVLSGCPHAAACDRFARHVLPRLDHAPLSLDGA